MSVNIRSFNFWKRLLLFSFVLAACSETRGQAGLFGKTKLQSSKNKPLVDVHISHLRANDVYSKTDGAFALLFDERESGDTIRNIIVRKNGYELINKNAKDVVVLAANELENPLVLVFAKEGEYDRRVTEFYEALDANANKWYKDQLKNSNAKISDLDAQLALMRQRNEENARILAAIDLDQTTERYQQAFSAFNKGNYKLVHQILDSASLDKQLQEADQLQAELNKKYYALAAEPDLKAMAYLQVFQFKKAAAEYEKVINIYERFKKAADKDLAEVYNRLANTYAENGEFEKALSKQWKSLKIKKLLYDSLNNELAIGYGNIAAMHLNLGTYDSCLYFGKKMLRIAERDKKPNKELAVAYNLLSVVYKLLGGYDQAVSYGEKSLKIQEELESASKNDLATGYGNFALVLKNLGQYDRAIFYQEKALDLMLQTPDSVSPRAAYMYDNLATIYQVRNNEASNDMVRALRHRRKALEILEQVLNVSHPELATAYGNIALTLYQLDDNTQALKYQMRAIQILEKISPSHINLGLAYSNTCLMYYERDQYDSAHYFGSKARNIHEATLGFKHPDLAITYNNLALALRAKKDYKNAIALRLKAIEIQEAHLPANARELATSYHNIAAIYLDLKETSTALAYERKVIDLFKNTADANNSIVLIACKELVSIYARSDRLDSAIYYQKMVINTLIVTYPPNTPKLPVAYHLLATLYADKSDFVSAIPFEEKAYTLLKNANGVDTKDIQAVLYQLTMMLILVADSAQLTRTRSYFVDFENTGVGKDKILPIWIVFYACTDNTNNAFAAIKQFKALGHSLPDWVVKHPKMKKLKKDQRWKS